ncbi:hypothetical protein DIZ76_016075 [Coccidioides immitis]|nr:hypothetical protein DIZ76_016075 [Coccidioides immitis]
MASSSPSGRSAYPENYMLQLIDELKTTIKTIRKDQLLMISIEMIKVFTDSSRRMDSTHLPELISLFDGDNYENCFRLDVASLHCVIHILLRASPCMARERGFYLLLESMTELTALTQNPIDPGIMVSARQRKSILGRKSCRSLFGTFIKDHPMVARRWSGQYILELLKHSTDNTKFVLSFGRHLRNLGAMVLMSEISYDLRLISAMIIQQLMLADPDPSSFWPQDTDHIFFSWLIRGAAIDAAWMKSFIKLLSMIDKTNVASNPQATSHLFGAAKIKPVALLETSDLSISSDDHPLTIATDLETISFFILSQGRLQIVDIPRNFIEDISVEVADSCLHIDMVEGTHCVTSGLPVTTDVVYVTFEKSRTALGILDALDGVVVPHASQEMSQEPSGSSVGGNANTQNQAKATKDQVPKCQRQAISAAIDVPGPDEGIGESPARAPAKIKEAKDSTERNRHAASSAAIELVSSDNSSTQSKSSTQATSRANRADKTDTTNQTTNTTESGYGSLSSEAAVQNGRGHPARDANHEPATASAASPSDGDGNQSERRDAQVQVECGSAEGWGSDLLDSARRDLQRHQQQLVGSQCCESHASSSTQHLQADSMQKTPINVPAVAAATGQPVLPSGTASAGNGSRLKRPHHKINGSVDKPMTMVDWDQDLRTENDEERPTAIKKQKITSRTAKPKNPLLATPGSKNDVLPTLPLSPKAPEVNPAPRKRAINREKRQVTKTLASARQKRSAASKAAEKLAHATKMENLPYDLDDPIESSAPERPRIAPDTDAMEIDRMGINDNPEKSHNQPPTSRQQEGELKLPADSNSSKDITLELASSLPEGHMQPMPFSEESTRPHNEVQVQPTWPENPNDGRDNCRTSSTPSRKRKSVASDGSLMSHEDSIEADMPANKRLKEDYSNGQASGNKLATAIKTAGVEVDHKPNDNVTIQGNNNSCEAESIKKRPQINKTLESSQISRNVSLFIAKQNAKGQNTDTTGDIQNIQNDAEDQDCNRASPMQPQTLETEAHRELKHARNTNNRLSKVQMQNQSQVSDADIEIATSAPNADSIDGSSGQRSGSLNASAHGDYTASAVHSVIMISSDCEELQGNMIVNSTSINDLSEDTVTVGHTMKGPLDSQIKTVDENGSPRPRQISRRSRVNGVQLGCAQQDQEKHKEKPGAPSLGIRGNAAGKVTNDVESERLEGGFEEDSTGIASHNISNDSSSSLNPPESTLNKRHAISGVPETTNRNPKLNTRAKGKPKEPSTVIKKLKGVVNTSRNVNKVRRSTRISKAPSSRGRNNNRHIPRASSDGVDASGNSQAETKTENVGSSEAVSSSWTTTSSEGISGDATQEWQKALRATQKATLDILLDTSNRLVRHLMNEEAAILNVVDVYKKGGDRILDQLEEMHKKSLNTFLGKLRPVKKGLNDLRQGILRQLEENELVLGDIATKKFSRRCEKNKQALQRKIENTAKKV